MAFESPITKEIKDLLSELIDIETHIQWHNKTMYEIQSQAEDFQRLAILRLDKALGEKAQLESYVKVAIEKRKLLLEAIQTAMNVVKDPNQQILTSNEDSRLEIGREE